MAPAIGSTAFITEFGWCGLAWTEAGICAATLPSESREAAGRELSRKLQYAGISSPEPSIAMTADARAARKWCEDYFRGGAFAPGFRLDLEHTTGFQRRACGALLKIPRGQVRSYTWLAAECGMPQAPRAAGTACARNPLPVIVPCHRVVRSSGSVGGFAGGPELKRRMLELEGAMPGRARPGTPEQACPS
ncbi:MAG: methylated-DNA--[protein]-cysteine S-methyltransferase [Bacillota bacterium]|nr:methylated-DNA--[protein]-cysteine S-methyltransferase [Bacillota bacterium]